MNVLSFGPNAANWHQIQQSAAFWNVDPATLDPARHRVWIVHRILQFGSWGIGKPYFAGMRRPRSRTRLGIFWEA